MDRSARDSSNGGSDARSNWAPQTPPQRTLPTGGVDAPRRHGSASISGGFIGQPGAGRSATERVGGAEHGRRTTRRPPRALVALAALVMLASACLPPTTSTSGPPTAAPGERQAAPEVLVGATISSSGRFSREGAALRAGYDAWVRAANDAGGINVGGAYRGVRLIAYDDESEPLVAARMVERLIQQDGVSLLLGPFSSQLTTASVLAAERFGAVTVAPDASAPSLYGRALRGVVSILPPDDTYLAGLVQVAGGLSPRPRSVALLVPEQPAFVAAADGFVEGARALGIGPVEVERYALDAREIPEALDRIAQVRPDVLIVVGEPERLQLFLPQLRELRLAPPMRALVPTQRFHDLVGLVGTQLEGTLSIDAWSPDLVTSGPVLGSARDFAELFQRLHGYPPDSRAAAAAAAGLALQLGIERAGSTAPSAVRAALGELDVGTFWGRLAWDGVGRNRATTAPVLQFRQGRSVPIFPSELASQRLLYPIGGWP